RRYAPPSPRSRGEGKRHAPRLRGEGEKHALLFLFSPQAGISFFPFSPLAGRRCRRRMRGAFRVALASVDYLATGDAARERLPPRTPQRPWPLIRRYAPPSPRLRGEGKRHAPRLRGEGKKYALLFLFSPQAGISFFPFSPLAGRRCRRRMRGAFRVALANIDYLATGNVARSGERQV